MKMPLSNRKAASKHKILRSVCPLDLLSGSELASILAVYFSGKEHFGPLPEGDHQGRPSMMRPSSWHLRPDSEIGKFALGMPQSFAVIVASPPTLVQSSKGDADGRSRPGFMTLSGSSPPLIAATASTPSGEISSVSHGRCSVPTAW